MKTAKICSSRTCVNFACCYGNQGWVEGLKIIFALEISSFKLSESLKSVSQGVRDIFEEVYLGLGLRLVRRFLPLKRYWHYTFKWGPRSAARLCNEKMAQAPACGAWWWAVVGRLWVASRSFVKRPLSLLVYLSFLVEALLDNEQWVVVLPLEPVSVGPLQDACRVQVLIPNKCIWVLSLTTGRGTATALHSGKGQDNSRLSIKTQRRTGTAWFHIGSDLPSHACGSTEIGWTLSVLPGFGFSKDRPNLRGFQWRTREGLWREQKVEVWLRLTSAWFFHGVLVKMRALGTVFGCQCTGCWSNHCWKLAFLGCAFSAPFLPQGSFASSNQIRIV